MTLIVLQGFVLGLAYAMPIGAQNLFVINSSSRGTLGMALRTAMIFAIMDISLGVACILGVGQIVQSHDLVKLLIAIIGAIFLGVLGYRLVTSRLPKTSELATPLVASSMWKAAFILT